jgi:type VI secretion system protein ImpL
MWLWILSALFLALVWAVWFVLRPTEGGGPEIESFPTWIPIATTAVVVVALVGVVVYRRVRAARAARALEKAIAQQAQEQALNAKPERRAEIQELERQILQGINSLKSSKLGGKSGVDALYTLPWYVMVGPPGAGKTTALRHSGLAFPYLDPSGGGVRGVGGTRNCDWWFTNEAILLDTAGRYTTDADDHDEWMAFLEQLLKYRAHKPVNGVIVAVSLNELLDATDEQIEATGKKVRARIDEMQSTLHMVLPVYVVFTKTDLIAGFSEFFGDLKKSDRSQAWGATIRLDEAKAEPGKIFDREFDILVENLHLRTLKRMASEPRRETKEKIYQFPLEFAPVKRNLSDFMAAAFAPAAMGATPILRGFYFTSGTQEGKPLDRVVGAMGRAFGLRGSVQEETTDKAESKSYFLRDVFMGVIFPDQDIAARTEAEIRRQRFQRMVAAFAAALVALVLIIPAMISYFRNRELVAETDRVSQDAAQVDWRDGKPAPAKVEKLDKIRQHAELLDTWEREGPPLSYRWGMYTGDTLFKPTVDQYVSSLEQGFVRPTKERLEAKLRASTGEKYLEDYNALKAYLLLDDKVHLNAGYADWEVGQLTNVWAEILRPSTDLSETDLKLKIQPHVKYYVDLLKRGVVKGVPVEQPLVDRTRDILTRVGSRSKYYDQFVTILKDEKYDETQPATRDNLKYPPVTLNEMFADRPEVLTKLHSERRDRENKWFEVEGPYTDKGHEQVISSLKTGYEILDREKWVVPVTGEEKSQKAKIQQELDRVREDYENEYMTQWVRFFKDVQVDVPPNNKEAIAEFRILSTPDWPYLRLLRTLSDHTQFDEKEDPLAAAKTDGGLVTQLKDRVVRKVNSKARTDVTKLLPGQTAEREDPIPLRFKSMVRFGVPAAPPKQTSPEAPPPPPPAPPGLAKYVGMLEQLSGEMGVVEDGPPTADTKKATESFQQAVQSTQSLLLTMDETGQELMGPLLMNPLKQAYRAMVRSAGGAASGLWEVEVWPAYRDTIKDRFPFNTASNRDASYADAVKFFKPKDGILWGFYDAHLQDYHQKTGHIYTPKSYLEARPRPAVPFTPFNSNLYNCLRRADEITDALFQGGEKPEVTFNINLKTVSPIVSEVIFEIDGQKRLYRNEKEFWHEFKWPGEKQTGARIQVRGAGGLDEELTRSGPWGIFRLFEAGTSEAEKDNDEMFTVTWQMTAPPVTVVMQVKPTRGNHPFPASFFRATNCPPSIGDRFGKGS